MDRLTSAAPAKVNLTLRVLGRRADGRHELASLVTFAAVGDTLALDPGAELHLAMRGPMAAFAGSEADNLVLAAARALAGRTAGLKLGRFELVKNLPVGAGLGGGSADAAAALRLIAQANGLAPDDARLLAAAREVGADVPVCLDPKARLMHGSGERLSAPLGLPPLDAVLVFPGVPLATAAVFRAFDAQTRNRRTTPYAEADIPRERAAIFRFLAEEANDLEPAACSLAPVIAEARALLERLGEPRLVRMTGSGSAVFALYEVPSEAAAAAGKVGAARPDWWVTATRLT